jgi:hypothetical protein
MAFVLALAFALSGFCQPMGGNGSKPQSHTSVLRIDQGYVDAQGVFIYYKSFGSGPPLLSTSRPGCHSGSSVDMRCCRFT